MEEEKERKNAETGELREKREKVTHSLHLVCSDGDIQTLFFVLPTISVPPDLKHKKQSKMYAENR